MTNIFENECLVLDLSNYPTVVITAKDIDPEKEQVEASVNLIDKALEQRTGSFCLIADGSVIKWVSACARVQMAKGVQKIEAKYANRFMFSVVVVPNPTVSMLLKGMNLVAQPKVTQVICKTIEEAQKVASERFQPEAKEI